MGISFSAFIAMLTVQNKETRFLRQQLASISVKYSLLQTLKNPVNCQCHFDSSTNKEIPEDELKIDTTKDPIGDIDLKSFRYGCDFDSSDNIIVKEDTEINNANGLKVGTVKVKGLRPTGTKDNYKGDLTIDFKHLGHGRALQPVSVPILLAIDSGLGSSVGRPIQSCGTYASLGSGNYITVEKRCRCDAVKTRWGGQIRVNLHGM